MTKQVNDYAKSYSKACLTCSLEACHIFSCIYEPLLSTTIETISQATFFFPCSELTIKMLHIMPNQLKSFVLNGNFDCHFFGYKAHVGSKESWVIFFFFCDISMGQWKEFLSTVQLQSLYEIDLYFFSDQRQKATLFCWYV